MTKQLTAIIEREGDGYVALCPVGHRESGCNCGWRENLKEALELFFEAASDTEFSIGS